MCHWVLRIWTCGDSFFTKYSSCSFDRAAHDPAHLLNPLHPSITPFGEPIYPTGTETAAPPKKNRDDDAKAMTWTNPRSKQKRNSKNKAKNNHREKNKNGAAASTACLSLPPAMSSAERSPPEPGSCPEAGYARDARTGQTIPVLLSEIGKGSRFGDKALVDSKKCYVFEVVLQTKEPTMCPACSKNPKRARLPAHARGCFAPS